MARAGRYADRTLPTADARFDAKVRVIASGCHEWHGYVDSKGYGVFGVGGRKLMKAHRYAYQRAKGEVPEGLQLDHTCRNRRCVNPAHLEPVSNQENTARGVIARGSRAKCRRGHAMTWANTYLSPKGTKDCRECRRLAVLRARNRRI